MRIARPRFLVRLTSNTRERTRGKVSFSQASMRTIDEDAGKETATNDALKTGEEDDDSNATTTTTVTTTTMRALDDDARRSILAWYDANKRELPWRVMTRRRRRVKVEVEAEAEAVTVADAARMWTERAFEGETSDGEASVMGDDQYAYGVLVSEIMSQQTQIDRVAEYWTRWVARWPTARALAEASQEDVNEEWAGLGYYRRAGFLLKGAKYVSEDLGGRYPRTAAELLKIPGVGPYTSSAVSSIAFGERTAAVDGNVHRVLTRARLIKGDPTKGETAKELRRVADAFVDAERSGDFNQAMMELGATVCTPTNPKCAQCPIAAWCEGLSRERETSGVFKVTELPETAKKAEKRQEQRAYVVLRRGTKEAGFEYLLSKRPEGGLLSGLWEFPNSLIATETDDAFANRPKSDVTEAHEAICDALVASSTHRRIEAVSGKAAHVFSHVRQVMHYQLVHVETADCEHSNELISVDFPNVKWFPARAFEESGIFTSGVAKVYAKCARGEVKHSGAQKRKFGVNRTDEDSQKTIRSFFTPRVDRTDVTVRDAEDLTSA